MGWYSYSYFKPYVPVATRQANALKEVAKLQKKGQTIPGQNCRTKNNHIRMG